MIIVGLQAVVRTIAAPRNHNLEYLPEVRYLISLFLCSLVLPAWAVLPPPPAEPVVDIAPQVVWGRPLEEGTIRGVAAAPGWAAYDAAQLACRLDIDLTFCEIPSSDEICPPVGEELAETIRKHCQVLIVPAETLQALPAPLLDTIPARVQEGMGLLITRNYDALPPRIDALLDEVDWAQDTAPVTEGIGGSATPEWREQAALVRIGGLAKGRVVVIDYGLPKPPHHMLLPPLQNPLIARPVYLDTYFSLAAKAVRWAAGHDSSTLIDSITLEELPQPDSSEIPSDFLEEYVEAMRKAIVRFPSRQFTIRLSAPAPRRCFVKCQIRRPGISWPMQREQFTSQTCLQKGQGTFPLNLPVGPGECFLDVWLIDTRDRVISWFSQGFALEGWPKLSGLAFSKTALSPHDVLYVSATVDAPAQKHIRPVVFARAFDGLNRLVASGYEKAPTQKGPVRVPVGILPT